MVITLLKERRKDVECTKMKRGDKDRLRANALIRMLEGEVMILADTVNEAMHWDRPNDLRDSLCRIRQKAEQIAQALDVDIPKV